MANEINGFYFKSSTIKGNLAKTYVHIFDDDTLIIRKICFTKEFCKKYKILRKFKDAYLVEEIIGFKMDSFFNIANEVYKLIK